MLKQYRKTDTRWNWELLVQGSGTYLLSRLTYTAERCSLRRSIVTRELCPPPGDRPPPYKNLNLQVLIQFSSICTRFSTPLGFTRRLCCSHLCTLRRMSGSCSCGACCELALIAVNDTTSCQSCIHTSTTSTRLNRPQIPSFKSSVRPE